MIVDSSQKFALKIGFMILIVFAILRPISLTFTGLIIGNFNAFEIFAIGISYLLLFLILINFTKFPFDSRSLLAVLFCMYCMNSIFWGSNVDIIARVTIPFLIFFSARMFIRDSNQITAILIALFIGYSTTIIGSIYNIALGRSISDPDYYSGLVRNYGAFKGSHILGYTMLTFSFIYCYLSQKIKSKRIVGKAGLNLAFSFSVLCLYLSYTRTALLGFIVFWLVFLWGSSKKRLLVAVIGFIALIFLSFPTIERIVWKTPEHDVKIASSGRPAIWEHNVELFFKSSLAEQLLGQGLGSEGRWTQLKDIPWASHNDYLSLLMTLGVIGLLIYLSLLGFLVWDIYSCQLDPKEKYLFGGILASVINMNFVSNAIIFRVELSQIFWLFMGLFYRLNKLAKGG